MKKAIETYWDPSGFKGGKRGCWRARLQDQHSYHDAGTTESEAVRSLLLTLASFGMSGDREEYYVTNRLDWYAEEGHSPKTIVLNGMLVYE